jgi:glutamine synthetase
MTSTSEKMLDWLNEQTEIESLRAGVCDLNGIMRGKLIPVSQARKALNGDLRIPLSATSVDIWGNDIENSRLVYETGDGDGILEWTGRSILPMDWMGQKTGLIPLWLANEDGTPFLADPRRALADVLAKYKKLGLTPVVATELEFYLVDPDGTRPAAPKSPATGRSSEANAVLSLDELDRFDGFFNDVYAACAEQDVPADAAIAEGGAGQFEINLLHCNDALCAADDAMLFKRIVKGTARKHNLTATFMAKPYQERAGNGLHIHFSLLNEEAKNVFDDGSEQGSLIMQNAVAGLLAAMKESSLIFAPHLNSYRRLQRNTHAPSTVCWGYENRHAAIRIPGGAPIARRIEHRVAGADANPYLVMAVMLGAALWGIENKKKPDSPVSGDQFSEKADQLPEHWHAAIAAFEQGRILTSIFSPLLLDLFASCKKQEYTEFSRQMTDFEFSTYLETT